MTKLIRPGHATQQTAHSAALTCAGHVALFGGTADDLRHLLVITGLIPDPGQRSRASLGLDRCHPYGRRTP